MTTDAAFPHRLASRRTAIPDAPTREVHDAIATAAERYDQLVADDHHIHFGIGAFTRRLSAELRDGDGHLIESLSARRALELACGPLPF